MVVLAELDPHSGASLPRSSLSIVGSPDDQDPYCQEQCNIAGTSSERSSFRMLSEYTLLGPDALRARRYTMPENEYEIRNGGLRLAAHSSHGQGFLRDPRVSAPVRRRLGRIHVQHPRASCTGLPREIIAGMLARCARVREMGVVFWVVSTTPTEYRALSTPLFSYE